jgi:hypothetical protein
MVALLAWFLMAYGLSNILVYGSIFNNQRNFIHKWGNNVYSPFQGLGKFLSGLISCMMCTSTWVGFFLGIFLISPTNFLFGTSQYISWFFDGVMSSGAVWAINAIIEWYEQNRPK